jgi:hypothetical protein
MSSMSKRDYAAKQKRRQDYKNDHDFRSNNSKRDRRHLKERPNREQDLVDVS